MDDDHFFTIVYAPETPVYPEYLDFSGFDQYFLPEVMLENNTLINYPGNPKHVVTLAYRKLRAEQSSVNPISYETLIEMSKLLMKFVDPDDVAHIKLLRPIDANYYGVCPHCLGSATGRVRDGRICGEQFCGDGWSIATNFEFFDLCPDCLMYRETDLDQSSRKGLYEVCQTDITTHCYCCIGYEAPIEELFGGLEKLL
jgi:hypothetical protein